MPDTFDSPFAPDSSIMQIRRNLMFWGSYPLLSAGYSLSQGQSVKLLSRDSTNNNTNSTGAVYTCSERDFAGNCVLLYPQVNHAPSIQHCSPIPFQLSEFISFRPGDSLECYISFNSAQDCQNPPFMGPIRTPGIWTGGPAFSYGGIVGAKSYWCQQISV